MRARQVFTLSILMRARPSSSLCAVRKKEPIGYSRHFIFIPFSFFLSFFFSRFSTRPTRQKTLDTISSFSFLFFSFLFTCELQLVFKINKKKKKKKKKKMAARAAAAAAPVVFRSFFLSFFLSFTFRFVSSFEVVTNNATCRDVSACSNEELCQNDRM